METLYQLKLSDILREYYKLTQEAHDTSIQERNCATKIQAAWRRYKAYQIYKKKHNAIVLIQKCYRGICSRIAVKNKIKAIVDRDRECLLHSCAIAVQRYFRGYFSRKYVHDYYKRKLYLLSIVEKNNRLMENVLLYAYESGIERDIRAKEAQQKAFNDKISTMHHLVSTTIQPSYLRCTKLKEHEYLENYITQYHMENNIEVPRTTYDKPIETYHRKLQQGTLLEKNRASCVKTLPNIHAATPYYRLTPQEKSIVKKNRMLYSVPGPVLTKEDQLKRIERAQHENKTILASCPYDDYENQIRQETKMNKYERVSAKDFITTVRSRNDSKSESVNGGRRSIQQGLPDAPCHSLSYTSMDMCNTPKVLLSNIRDH